MIDQTAGTQKTHVQRLIVYGIAGTVTVHGRVT